MEMLILRHAETVWNAQGRLQGQLDSPLNAKGLTQIEAMRAVLAARDLDGWQWYCSPAVRACVTARKLMPDPAALIQDARLCEIGIGRWQDAQRDTLPLPDAPLHTEDGPIGFYLTAPDIEPLADLRARCASFLDQLTGPSIIVTHGIASRMLRLVALGLGDEALAELPGGQGRIFHIANGRHDILT